MTAGASEPPDEGRRGTPAIDRSVLGEWLPGDDAAINDMLIMFRDSIVVELARMRGAVARNDLVEYASCAHRLRGAALSMGARRLADVAGQLFRVARDGDMNGCAEGMQVLATHVDLMVVEVPPARGSGV